jgi:hypothetical protein
VAVTLTVIRRRIADGDAPSVHGCSENSSVELWSIVGTERHWDTEFDKIVDNGVQYFPRGWVPLPSVDDRPSEQLVGVNQHMELTRLEQVG